MEGTKLLVQLLNNIYVMEKEVEKVYESQLGQMGSFFQAETLFTRSLDHTSLQIEKIKACIKRLGGKPWEGKNKISCFMEKALIASVSRNNSDDFIKKLALLAALLQLEISSYEIIVSASRHLGDQESASIFRDAEAEKSEILAQFKKHLPILVQEVLHQKNMPSHGD